MAANRALPSITSSNVAMLRRALSRIYWRATTVSFLLYPIRHTRARALFSFLVIYNKDNLKTGMVSWNLHESCATVYQDIQVRKVGDSCTSGVCDPRAKRGSRETNKRVYEYTK